MRQALGVSEAQAWQIAEQVMDRDLFLTFWLRHDAEFTSAQIGEMLGITRQAVDQRLARASRVLAAAIEEAA